MKNRFMTGVVIASALLLPVVALGCSDDAGGNPLCCDEFKVGTTVKAEVGSTPEARVAAQAVADVAGIAAGAIEDLTTACRGIAQDLDGTKAEQDAAETNTDKNKKMQAWCTLAVKRITEVKGSATLTINATPPVCEASFSAKADCQAKCTVDGQCNVKATPPTCEGGKLEVACNGSCTAKAGATLTCEGKCTGTCTGSCTAQGGGVECQGRCDGTCSGTTDSGGNCQGKCVGTCAVVKPNVTCEGSCNGTCSASCTGTAQASVKCDGECSVDAQPISCKGGTLKGGCQVDAKCDANCEASVKAKASCTPPSVDVRFAGNVEAYGKLVATLKANLPIIFSLGERLEALGKITGEFEANITAVADVKAACVLPLALAVRDAVKDITEAASASASVTGSFTLNPK